MLASRSITANGSNGSSLLLVFFSARVLRHWIGSLSAQHQNMIPGAPIESAPMQSARSVPKHLLQRSATNRSEAFSDRSLVGIQVSLRQLELHDGSLYA